MHTSVSAATAPPPLQSGNLLSYPKRIEKTKQEEPEPDGTQEWKPSLTLKIYKECFDMLQCPLPTTAESAPTQHPFVPRGPPDASPTAPAPRRTAAGPRTAVFPGRCAVAAPRRRPRTGKGSTPPADRGSEEPRIPGRPVFTGACERDGERVWAMATPWYGGERVDEGLRGFRRYENGCLQ